MAKMPSAQSAPNRAQAGVVTTNEDDADEDMLAAMLLNCAPVRARHESTSRCFVASMAWLLCAACSTKEPPATSRVFANPPGVPRPPRALVIDVASPDAPCTFTRGFSGAEPWRWSIGKSSRVDFDFRPDPRPMLLELLLRAAEGPAPQIVTVLLNDRVLGELRPEGREREHHLDVPVGALREGHNVLEMKYAWSRRASEQDPRDIAVAFRRIAVVPVPDRAAVRVGADDWRAKLGAGWSHDERDSERTFIWSDGPTSTLSFSFSPRAEPYTLRLEGLAIAPDVSLAVIVGEREVARVTPPAGWSAAAVAIPGDALRDGRNELVLRYSKTQRPAALDPKSTDTRELGYALVSASLAPTEE